MGLARPMQPHHVPDPPLPTMVTSIGLVAQAWRTCGSSLVKRPSTFPASRSSRHPLRATAAREMRTGLPRAKVLHEQAKTVGTASTEGIQSAGFDVIPTPSTALPNHHRIIHPDGAAGFTDANLGRLAEVFRDSTGH